MEKLFVCHLSDKHKELMTESLIKDHVEYLKSLKVSGKLRMCGPCLDGTAIMILVADSEVEAQSLVDEDPFSHVNYYRTKKIVEVREATMENNFHLDEVLLKL